MRFSRIARSWLSLAGLLVLVLGASLPLSASAASSNAATSCTTLGGTIGVDTTLTTAGSPYCVTTSVDVLSGVTLTIQPGVVLNFSPTTALQIDGALIARGTSASKISFTSANATPAPGDWGYIYFSPTSVSASFDAQGNYTGGSVIQYAVIAYAGSAPMGVPAIQANGSAPFLDHNTFQSNSGDGIDVANASTVAITFNQIVGSGTASGGAYGIYVSQQGSGQSAFVSGNNVSGHSSAGIYLDSASGTKATVSGNSVSASFVDGIDVKSQDGTMVVSGNMVSASGRDGIDVNTFGSAMTVTGNTFNTSGRFGIHLKSGPGSSSYAGSATVSGNAVSGNRGGGISANANVQTAPSPSAPQLTINGNVITGNGAPSGGGGMSVVCTGCSYDVPSVVVTGNTVSGNGGSNGGGLSVYIAGKSTQNGVAVTNNTISSNKAASGGGVYLYQYVPSVFTGNVIAANSASSTNAGGGIYLCGTCPGAVTNNAVYGNTAGSPAVANDVSNGNPSGTTFDATNNWWGTTNTTTISTHIWDFYDQSTRGIVAYQPILTTMIPLSDLIVGTVGNPPTTVARGSAFSASGTITNTGTGSASASTIGFYLSPTPAKGTGTQKLKGTPVVIDLALGAQANGKATVTVATTTPTGAYYLIACANDNGLVLESNNTNDCKASTTQVTVQ